MILQRSRAGSLLIRQTDHALLSGAFAAAWGNETFPAPRNPGSAITAAARHDDGWAQWELAPRLNRRGEPMDFLQLGVREHVELYTRCIDLVEQEDPFAGCLVSLHGKRLYTRPLQQGGKARYTYLEGADLELARRFVEGEQERERRLLDLLAREQDLPAAPVRADLEETWRLLQVWDRLSLFLCMQPLESGLDLLLPPVRGAGEADVQIRMRTAPGRVILDPYPFTQPNLEFQVIAIRLGQDSWPDDAAYRRSLRTAPRRLIELVATPPS